MRKDVWPGTWHVVRIEPWKESEMKVVAYVISIILILAGLVWFLQGINVLPGSFMTGQIEWAVGGAVAIVLGIVLGWYTRRRM